MAKLEVTQVRSAIGTKPKQRVRPTRQARCDLARHRKDIAPFLEREIGGDQRTAALACLDDHGDMLRALGVEHIAHNFEEVRRLVGLD